VTALRSTILLATIAAAACVGGGDCPHVQVTDDTVHSMWPSLAWTGTEYGIAWQHDLEDGEIRFARLDQDGERIGDDVVIGPGRNPVLIWNGTGYTIVWGAEDTVHLALLDAEGAMTFLDTFPGDAPTLTWTGTEYGVAYLDPPFPGESDVYLARFDDGGLALGSQQLSADPECLGPCRAQGPSVAWNGSEYGVAWIDNRDGAEGIYFASVHPTTGASPEVVLAPGDGIAPVLASDGTDFALTWSERLALHFQRLTVTGAPIGDSVMLSSDVFGGSALIWNGTSYGAAWIFPEQIDTRLEVAEVDGAGVPGPGSVVGDAAELGATPSLVWNASRYAVAWGAPPYGATEIEFGVVGCEP
jgi:hypothetical protein